MKTIPAMFDRLARRLTVSPLIALLVALALLIGAFALAIQNDRLGKAEKLRQASVQAQVLASSLAAPLAFDDENATREYLRALRADAAIQAAAAYDERGKFVAGFAQAGNAVPPNGQLTAPAFQGRDLIVTAEVAQDGSRIGMVYLRSSIESGLRRAMRYIGIALIIVFASFLVGLLGAAYASLRRAHEQLQAETASREKAEAALRQSQKMEAMGQLTGGVAHDFNNLLMVASGGLELLERTSDPARRERLTSGIRQAVDRGAKLTQQLLTFARRSPLKPEIVDLAGRIHGMDELLNRSLREDVKIAFDLADNLWPIEVDPSQLEVAILNMALNARDAMPDGGTIRISARNRTLDDGRDCILLEIADTGTGIAPDKLNQIFEPFFTTKGVGQGTGLGLSQVYGFAKASGGEIQAESELGKGTVMRLLLPRTTKAMSQPESRPTRPQARAAARRNALLVEDDDTVAAMVGTMLDDLGFDHNRVGSADAALKRMESGGKVDLVLSDMVMPGEMSGLDLVRVIGRKWPGIPAVLMTGYSDAASAASAEGVRLLHKPYRIDALAAEIEAAIKAN
ncbi:histidine kinase [Sphingomonas sp. Root710]|uniref:hybrid sensor histidine kinase/response regulator n=1 Tax=Sphingomonas sp. Root710 TaxID=1736594 RepID=UPI0006F6ED7B|nr:hybrid sensor histidine kinase/response regulator [Sphingomonas sp. Root710]KRB79729.1 histidine kinase [Sphingomonas sp. Root710]